MRGSHTAAKNGRVNARGGVIRRQFRDGFGGQAISNFHGVVILVCIGI